jgi:hypothetical protein
VSFDRSGAVSDTDEDRDTETEFVMISYRESVEAMWRFAGSDPTRIHHVAGS